MKTMKTFLKYPENTAFIIIGLYFAMEEDKKSMDCKIEAKRGGITGKD